MEEEAAGDILLDENATTSVARPGTSIMRPGTSQQGGANNPEFHIQIYYNNFS